MTKLLIIDSETGGLDPLVHSILSFAGVVWEDGVNIAKQEFLILEDPLVVTPKAMEINRINLVEHAKKAMKPAAAMAELVGFIYSHFGMELKRGELVVPVGHNVGFDIGMLRRLCRLAGYTEYDKLFSHRSVDTASILRILHLAGKLPASALSSDGAFKYFNIIVPDEERHTAFADADATGVLVTHLLALVRV